MNLLKLGFRSKREPLLELFSTPGEPSASAKPIQPDVDYHPEEELKPQCTDFAQMWIQHFQNWGNIKNPT